ncbi:hypothetical protein [Bacillus sp. FJAT-27245]|uniref:hypothetical protein n=1 Tax=Bacillus sp. FJAT-27245 TaxID=1684144 RepID=UPI0006A7CF50|nr:hypothetical protein [Bacillus sp. FJAT-27245]
MSGETLPGWVWLIYYAFLIVTFCISVYSVVSKKNIALSIVNIIVILTVPVVSLVKSIPRTAGNELEFLFKSLFEGSVWAFYVLAGYLFIAGWWAIFLKSNVARK